MEQSARHDRRVLFLPGGQRSPELTDARWQGTSHRRGHEHGIDRARSASEGKPKLARNRWMVPFAAQGAGDDTHRRDTKLGARNTIPSSEPRRSSAACKILNP